SVTAVQRMRVKSVIISPRDHAVTSRTVTVSGWAWSGDGAITRVEVGLDGGNDWRDATLGAPASAYAWTPWSCTVVLPRAGRFVLRSRATDASGATQPDHIVWNRLGYGNNAVRQVVITAE
ncbi:MAG: Ig-like domain-containing protein, partial [Gemmatimonadaceae bacterium]